jgi:HEAT repeat protein
VSLAAGSTFGPYRIDGPLGRGGMGSVYRAYEPALDRHVALKILPAEFLHDETFAERFRREAKVVARLEHPSIVPIYAFDIERGQPWMAMRLIAGGALSGLLKKGRLEPARAIAILRGAAEALAYAHVKGVVHRDVKPQNILLDEDERGYLADFGIGRMVDGSNKLTMTGMISGTPQYMAPEQAMATSVDGRADTYALGVVAYEMFTGRVPFAADTPVGVLMKHVQEPIPRPPAGEVGEPLMEVVLKALAKKPEDRWPTAVAIADALTAALQSLPTARLPVTVEAPAATEPSRPAVTRPKAPPPPAARPAAPPEPAPRRAGLPTAVLVAAAVAGGLGALGVAAGVAYWAWSSRSNVRPVPPTPAPATAAPALREVAAARVEPTPSPAAPPPPAAEPAASAPPSAAPSAPPARAPAPPRTREIASAPAAVGTPRPTPPPPVVPEPAGPSEDVRALVRAFEAGRGDERWKAAEALGNLGAEAAAAAPQLAQGLKDRDEVVRWRCAEALGKIGAAAAAADLAGALRDRNGLVRSEAAKALGRLGLPAREAAPALAELLADPDPYARREAAKALVAMAEGASAQVPALVRALADKDKFVRIEAAKALGRIGPEAGAAVPALTALRQDKDPLASRAAAEALRRIEGSQVGAR